MPSEFDIIRKYFVRPTRHTRLGIGDDCALLQPDHRMELAVSTDMLVSGTHFFPDADPFQLGHKVLAVNLSDLAAMGATPRWCTLAAALPEADEAWISAFASGFFSLADRYGVDLIGGDTTRGSLNFCVQIMGEVPVGAAITRSSAKEGDDVWVSGELGGAALALAHIERRIRLDDQALAICLPKLHTPMPRIELGLALRGIATSCIDISDGLLGDLGHILDQSSTGAEIWLEALPRSAVLDNCAGQEIAQNCLLAGGDDYELCFTSHADHHGIIRALAERLEVRLTCIGRIDESRSCKVLDAERKPMKISATGFDHFKK